MSIIPTTTQKKKVIRNSSLLNSSSLQVLNLGELEYLRKKKKTAFYKKMVLEFTMLEYHIIFFNGPISTSAVPRWQNS